MAKGIYAAVAVIIVSFALSVFLAGCSATGYELKLDAIRVVERDADKVNISLWVYDYAGKLIRNVFTPGALDPDISGGSWVLLNDPEFKSIPASSVVDPGRLELEIRLNPNRFMTPPDAIFKFTVELKDILREPENKTGLVVTSENGAYELRVWIKGRVPRGKTPALHAACELIFERA